MKHLTHKRTVTASSSLQYILGSGVTCNVLHPGTVSTDLVRNVGDLRHFRFFWRTVFRLFVLPISRFTNVTPKEGAQTTIYCAIAPELEGVSGKYFR